MQPPVTGGVGDACALVCSGMVGRCDRRQALLSHFFV